MHYVVPKDIPLPLPAPFWLLVTLLLVSFMLHILFVNLMVGGSIMVLFTEIKGLKHKAWDTISLEIAKTITVNKSVAVVLGVGPLLAINVLYTVQFYTANALTGRFWLAVIPLVIIAFLLTYAHKYSWHALENHKGLHISFTVGATLLFLFIPFIFLTNINLMLYPEHWRQMHSFFDALMLPNVIPRYFHFLTASISIIALFLVKYLGREKYFERLGIEGLTREEVVRTFYIVAFVATGLQLFFGPLLFFTLPAHVISTTLFVLLLFVVIPLAITATWWLWLEVRSVTPGTRFWRIVGIISVIVPVMVYARHNIRETAIKPQRALVEAKTAAYMAKVAEAQNYLQMPGGLGGQALSPGEAGFDHVCAACHAFDHRVVGPPMNDAAKLYKGNPEGIVAWALNPGPSRPVAGQSYPQMPPQSLPRSQLLEIAKFILHKTGNE